MKVTLGTFEIISGSVVISDPCYTLDSWCSYKVKCQDGQYTASVVKKKVNSWGERIHELEAILSTKLDNCNYWKDVQSADIGVDSGQAGIFDSNFYQNNEAVKESDFGSEPWDCDGPFYSACGSHTLSDKQAGVLSKGCISSSGFGDGSYNLQVLEDENGIYGMKIVFIDEDQENA